MAAKAGLWGMGTAGTAAVVVAGVAVLGFVGRDVYMRAQTPQEQVTVSPAVAAEPEAEDTETASAPQTAAETPAADDSAALVEPEADATPQPTPEADPGPPPLSAPAFDVVRVEPDGTTLVAGTGQAGSTVTLFLDDAALETTEVDGSGSFVMFLSLEISKRPRLMTMQAQLGEETVWSEDQIILAPTPQPEPDTVAALAPDDAQPTAESETDTAEPVDEGLEPDSAAAAVSPEDATTETSVEPSAVIEDQTAAIESASGSEAAGDAAPVELAQDDAQGVEEETEVSQTTVDEPQDAQVETPAVTEPETTVAETTVAETTEPEPTDSDATVAEATGSEPTGSGVTATEVAVSETADSVSAAAETATTETAADETATTETANTETADNAITAEGPASETLDTAAPLSDPAEVASALVESDPSTDPTVASSQATDSAAQEEEGGSTVETAAMTPPVDSERAPEPEVPAPQAMSDPPVPSSGVTDAPTEALSTAERPEPEPQAPAPVTDVHSVAVTQTAAAEPQTDAGTAPRPAEANVPVTPDAPDALDAPQEQPRDFAAPETPASPGAVAVLRAGVDGVELLQPGTPERPEALDRLALDTISYSEGGEVLLAGRAPEGTAVRVYLDNEAVADLPIGTDGRWKGEVSGVRPGVYTLRLDQVAADGQVGGRIETPFKREAPSVLEAARSDLPPNAPSIAAVTVQRGDTLWAISQERYGSGFLYVRVFEANRDSIRDPDLIYPGQVFSVPN
ncbi:MAG: LysM peptidoglycan-binding domain-containing protein [Pseudomonadota bacterium]